MPGLDGELEEEMQPQLLNLLALLTIILLLVYSGLKRAPGIGIFLSLAIIAYVVWSHPDGLAWLGLQPQGSWPGTVGLALLCGAAIAAFSTIILEPGIERLTGRVHEVSIVEGVRGSWLALIRWLLVVWILVAMLEELIFRGYLISALSDLFGTSLAALILNLLLSSAIFGLAHAYQGPSGIISTGTIGLLIGLLYLLSGSNLWLVVLVHGFIDTIQLTLMSANLDQRLHRLIIKPGRDEK
jgi:membrane protease YdiL (CAAX protease family)